MGKRWYVVHVFSGFEKKMKQAILEQAINNNLDDMIEEVLVPTEDYVEMRRGTKVQAERKFFPGYVLVKMELTDATWSLVQSQPRVTGFLGGKGKQSQLQIEAERLLRQMDEGVERPVSTITFDIGEEVRVIDGPFRSFNGLLKRQMMKSRV